MNAGCFWIGWVKELRVAAVPETEAPAELATESKLRQLLGVALSWLVRGWARTWRIHWIDGPPARDSARRTVYAFWHGQQMALAARRYPGPLATLVSLSRDGQLQASVMRRLGLVVVRGSSSRGGARGLYAMIRAVQGGADAAFAVDGPRGPLYSAKRGALVVAERTRARLVPVACAARRTWVLERAWDRFEIPLPFTTVAIAVGQARRFEPTEQGAVELGEAIQRERARALQACWRTRSNAGSREV
jgi:lysophospholipid acyltransferase (LPLAT)-like uncharacterized protein